MCQWDNHSIWLLTDSPQPTRVCILEETRRIIFSGPSQNRLEPLFLALRSPRRFSHRQPRGLVACGLPLVRPGRSMKDPRSERPTTTACGNGTRQRSLHSALGTAPGWGTRPLQLQLTASDRRRWWAPIPQPDCRLASASCHPLRLCWSLSIRPFRSSFPLLQTSSG